MIFHNVHSACFVFFGTIDGRVPSVEVKGLKMDPSKFSTHSLGPGSRFQKGVFAHPLPTTMQRKGLIFLVLFPISFCHIHGT